jgi:NADPH2:quinone reductase
LYKQFGPPETLVVEDVPALPPAAGEVVVQVKAAGVNFPDSLIIQNKSLVSG